MSTQLCGCRLSRYFYILYVELMAFRGGGGGHSPGAVRVGRGSGRGNVSGRRGVGRSGANISTAADHTPRSPGSRRARPPEAMPTVTAPVPDPSSSTGIID